MTPKILPGFPKEKSPTYLSVIPSEFSQGNPLEIPSENFPGISLGIFSENSTKNPSWIPPQFVQGIPTSWILPMIPIVFFFLKIPPEIFKGFFS